MFFNYVFSLNVMYDLPSTCKTGHYNEEKHSLSKIIITFFNRRYVFHNFLTAQAFFGNKLTQKCEMY